LVRTFHVAEVWHGSLEPVVTPENLLCTARDKTAVTAAGRPSGTAATASATPRISADRLVDRRTDQPYYAAKIRVENERLAELDGIRIIPGMSAQVFIKTGRSTVALYALRPLLDSFTNAFRED
jgi:hypothetical protein